MADLSSSDHILLSWGYKKERAPQSTEERDGYPKTVRPFFFRLTLINAHYTVPCFPLSTKKLHPSIIFKNPGQEDYFLNFLLANPISSKMRSPRISRTWLFVTAVSISLLFGMRKDRGTIITIAGSSQRSGSSIK